MVALKRMYFISATFTQTLLSLRIPWKWYQVITWVSGLFSESEAAWTQNICKFLPPLGDCASISAYRFKHSSIDSSLCLEILSNSQQQAHTSYNVAQTMSTCASTQKEEIKERCENLLTQSDCRVKTSLESSKRPSRLRWR